MAKTDAGLWELALEHYKEQLRVAPEEEYSVLFVGSKNAGKTSIILRFLDRDEPPKPTVALEYTFGRRAKGGNMNKDVGHIWELGGGTWLSKLIDIPVNPDIKPLHMSLAIVLDLSKPKTLWFTLENMLKSLRNRVDSVINDIKQKDPEIKNLLKEKAKARYPEDHPDGNMVEPFPMPLAIIGGKYDIFADEFDSEKKKVVCKTLRFVAHMYGAHLLFFSVRQEVLINKARGLVSHFLFHTPAPKNSQFDHNKPIQVPVGQDTMENIGSPMIAEGDIGRIGAKTPIDLWKSAYQSYFPEENLHDPSLVEDPAKDPSFAEPSVDAMRLQKDQELERYRRMSERKMRDQRSQHEMSKAY